jgi:uncharacterized membrane protein
MKTMQNPITPDEQKTASLAQMLGIMAALPVWLSWRKRSAFVRLHAIQSMLLDVVLLVAVAASLGLLAAGLMGSVALSKRPDASLVMLAISMFGLPLCSLAGLLVVLTVVLLLRLRAAMAALQGREYRYPLLGWWG